ncbi:MAG: hypothetical protein JJU36_16130 [Phycisphaeraceae bacterium]|nr:hypothetical protein [Phycisphaeraceae bacterium]
MLGKRIGLHLLAAMLILGLAAMDRAIGADANLHITGRLLDANGTRRVPAAMFGVHAFQLTPERLEWGIEMNRIIHAAPGGGPTLKQDRPDRQPLSMIIDCLGDRYHPAPVLTNPNWRQYMTDLGTRYAQRARGHEDYLVVEFWNEPFLNWSTRPGVNYDPKFYEISEAEEGKPMRIRGWDEPLESLVWSRQVRTVDAAGNTNIQAYLAHSYIGHRHPAGYEFEFRNRQYRNVEMWWGRDPTQRSWYSGRQNQLFYDWMLLPFARALKETNPDLKLIAGWDFNFNVGDWHLWRSLYEPTIDNAIEYLDGITEHHYRVNADSVTAWYEVAVAYTVGKHDKWVKVYNTETDGGFDSQLPGNENLRDVDQEHPLRYAARMYTYHTRDVMSLLHHSVDKAAARAKHGNPRGGTPMSGDEAFFRFFKPLRGDLIDITGDDRRIWSVAAINQREVENPKLVVIVFNDHGGERRIEMRIDSPEGTDLTNGTLAEVIVDGEAQRLRITERDIEASGRSATIDARIPGRSAVRLVFPLEGTPPEEPEVYRRQFFAPGILNEITPEEATVMAIAVDRPALENARRAVLRLVLERTGDAGGRMSLNGQAMPVPGASHVVDIPIEISQVREQNTLRFEATRRAYRVAAASIILTGR